MHCKHTYIIHSVGLDCNRFENVQVDKVSYRSSIGVAADDIMILRFGKLSDRKNHQIIIKAV